MLKEFLLKLFQGIFIGISLVLPGMSGGTALIILGFYRTFLKDISELKIKRYLVIAVGMAFGVMISALLITKMLDLYPSILVSFLMGMLIASVKVVLTPGDFIKPKLTFVLFSLIGFFIAWNFISQPLLNVSGETSESAILFFAAGILTSATMLLPGVSGSSFLIMINLYDSLLKAVVNLDIWPKLVLFVFGLAAGVLFFSRVITMLYNKFQGIVSYFLAGLILGSTKALFPEEITFISVLSTIGGLLLVLSLTGRKPPEFH